MSHVYLNNRYTEEQIAVMKGTDSSAKIVSDFITQSEVNELQKMISDVEYPEHGKTSKYAGSSYEYEPHGTFMKQLLHERLLKHIGSYKLDFFAWQEAIIPWKVHADIRWYENEIPHKVILIPIDVIKDNENWADTYSITFKQRNYLRNNLNTNTGNIGNSDQKSWKRAIDNPNTEGCVEGYSIDKETYEKYLTHIPYEQVEGLEIDKIYKWEPGSAVIWDANQLHCADNFLSRGIKTKLSLLVMTNQAVV
jgi:hypothetical protein